MIKFTNFQAYIPDEIEFPEHNIGYLMSDEGVDWYASQTRFSENTIKICFDEKGIIRTYAKDISMLWPAGLSVTEVKPSAVPKGFTLSGEWFFDGKKILPRTYSAEEQKEACEVQKARLMVTAAAAIAPLQDAVEIGEATDSEKAQLTAWKKYRVQLNRIDPLTAPNIVWPLPPGAQAR